MHLEMVDWACIVGFFVISLAIGIWVSRRAGKSSAEFFLSGRSMPWWLLGVSMVATTFSTDTPNAVTDFVRQDGVSGNWVWWAFLLTGMMTVFVYAQLWRRSGVMTDVEFYELRYSGKSAAFLRGFRAIYLGVFFNVIIMASVTLAAIKIGGVMFQLEPWQTVLIAGGVTVVYSMLGGLTGVILTDFIQFTIAMIGAVLAAKVAVNLPEVGGLSGLLSNESVHSKINIMPDFTQTKTLMTLFILPLAVQWWAVWYPGAEPGGGGYIAQRMLAAKDEKNAVAATFLFNVAHYALRPWPWIIVALASLIIFPDLASLQAAFPHIDPSIVKHDLAYPAMLTFLPAGLLGMVIASLIAAYMSTISTHLNWGSSYVVNDFYHRFINPKASEKQLVRIGRLCTLVLMILTAFVALQMQSAKDNFYILLQVGAGTGLIFILRWFWWRINAWSEITAMVVSFLVAVGFWIHKTQTNVKLDDWIPLIIGVGITTFSWILATYLTKPTDESVLREFCQKIRPGGPGWAALTAKMKSDGVAMEDLSGKWSVPNGLLCMMLGCFSVWGALFATGYWIYGETLSATIATAVAVVTAVLLVNFWSKIRLS
jgi:solute:Na+ symporter, SSS family